MSTEDGRFDDGSSGPVRVADFDALDEADGSSPTMRVASFDLDDEDASDDEARVASFDDPPADSGSGGTPRRARFGGTAPTDRRGSGAGRRGGSDRSDRGGRSRGDRAGPADGGGSGRDVTRARPAFGRPVSDVLRGDADSTAATNGSGPPEPGADDDEADGTTRGRSTTGGRRGARGGRGVARADAGSPQDDESRAKEICLRLLTDRARTVQELRDALVRKEIPEDVADRVLERFDEVGLVDDEAFAGQWVRSRHRHRGLGKRAIAQELRRKGVAKEIADEALTEIDAESEEARARELVEKKIRTVKVGTREERASASRRLVGMLARKGYGAGVAYSVVRDAIAARGAEEDEMGEEPPED
ncbi:regulatory protein RecX [Pseudonocardia endophytica]|uniref:Regulatory protein RecX n=1 Tax=Pseudonocardia endophytica TaxID=401976 RepID=A0A4R1HYV6_PSEEN|nr:regulatory protein [Pseudonocardia endophytica]